MFLLVVRVHALPEAIEKAFTAYRYDAAIHLLRESVETNPEPELLIALSDAYIYKTFTLPKKKRLAVYDSARQVLLDHQELISTHIECYTRLALVSGQMASLIKPSQKGKLIFDMHTYTKTALEIDSADALAVFLDGYLQYRLSILSWFEKLLARTFFGRLPEMSLEEARRSLEKAVELDPGNAYFNFVLGRTLYVMKAYDEAKRRLEAALACDDRSIIDVIHKEEARQYLDAIRRKNYTFSP
jgi:tetratricopeptide (TPR) repeat protein